MSHAIEIRRMVMGVDSVCIDVDDETLERIKNKTITRSELNVLMDDAGELYTEAYDVEYPHAVAIINKGKHPQVLDYENEPDC